MFWFSLVLFCIVSFLFCLHLDCLLNVWPGVDAGDGPKRGANPVNYKEFHWSVATASKLKSGSEDRVEVSAAGGESSTDHAGGNEAVDGHSILWFLHGYKAGANPADPGGHSFYDCSVQDRHSEVSGADIVHGGVSTANMGLSNFYGPQHLDQSAEQKSKYLLLEMIYLSM